MGFLASVFQQKRRLLERWPSPGPEKIMTTLCAKAGFPYFKYNAFRHASASLMESINTPVGTIQKVLGIIWNIHLGHENRKTT
jgi:hypothetical protein